MPPHTPRPTGHRLVLVDDEPAFRRLLGLLLKRERFVVVGEAADGAAGIEAVERHAPDAVITDLQMPGADGLELTRAVRATRPDLPIVMLTGQPGAADGAYAAGVTAFLEKHDGVPRLSGVLRDLLEAGAGAETNAEAGTLTG